MSLRSPIFYSVWTAKTTTGTSKSFDIGSYRNQIFQVGFTGTSATIKAQVSNAADAPDFSASATESNQWEYADIAIQGDAGVITAGATGLVFSGSGVKSFEINQNGYNWCALTITAISSGSVTASLTLTSNQ